MRLIVPVLSAGGDARGDWRAINALAANAEASAARLEKALADIERLKRAGRPGGGWNFRGTYDADATYAVDDVVTVIGSGQGSYICRFAHGPDPDDHAPWLGEFDSGSSTQYWALLAPSGTGVWL